MRPCSGFEDRPEEGAVVVAAHGVGSAQIVLVLVWHVHVREPETAKAAPRSFVPRRVLGEQLRVLRDEGLVLDDDRDLLGRNGAGRDGRGSDRAAGDELLLHRVAQQVTRGLTGVHVEPRDPVRVVVVEHQPRALLVGVEEGQRTGTGVGHVRDVVHADALGVGGALAGRRGPLVRRAVADPRGRAAVQVQRGAVLLVRADAVRSEACAHRCRVGRDEQVPARVDRQLVDELHSCRPVPRRKDGGAEITGRRHCRARGIELHVAAQLRGRQVGVKLLCVLHERDDVVVGPRIGRGVRDRESQVLAEVVRLRSAQTRQRVHELPDAGPRDYRAARVELRQRAVRVVGSRAEVVRLTLGVEYGRGAGASAESRPKGQVEL